MELTSKQRAHLKSLANGIDPIFQVGKSSLSPEFKIAVLKNCADDPRMIADVVAERTHSTVVQVIGKKIILYKPDKKNPKIVLPR